MADNFQPKTLAPTEYKVVSQEGDVIWVEGALWSGNNLSKHRSTASVVSAATSSSVITNNILRIFDVGPVAEILVSSEEDVWDLSTPEISVAGTGYVVGEKVRVKINGSGLDLPDINLTVETVDSKGGITGFAPINPSVLPMPLNGVFSVTAPSNPITTTTTAEDGTKSTSTAPGTAASASVSSTLSSTSTPSYVEATRIVLGGHQGGSVGSGYLDASGNPIPHARTTVYQNLVGQSIVFPGVGAESVAERVVLPNKGD